MGSKEMIDINTVLASILLEGAEQFGMRLGEKQLDHFNKYMELLKQWNEKINLTAIEDDKDIIVKHFVDSLSILPHIPGSTASMIDIGTGAGFPGLPLKIASPHIEVTLLDSLDKRVKFLREVIDTLRLSQITAMHGRAEDFGVKPDFREKFELAAARAVASLPVLLEYCLPFVKTGGVFIAMKGSSTEEIGQSKKALDVLGGEIESVREFVLPSTDIKRNILAVRKLRQTPTKYPRKAGKPSKEPLI